MSRLIDAEKLEEVMLNIPFDELADGFAFKSYRFVMDSIHNQPTVDPLVHARWITGFGEDNCKYHCSYCGGEKESERFTNFCPNCGAKMDKEDSHEIDRCR